MVVIVRIDLDLYGLEEIENFIRDGIVTVQEARQSVAVKALDPVAELMWIRKMQEIRGSNDRTRRKI